MQLAATAAAFYTCKGECDPRPSLEGTAMILVLLMLKTVPVSCLCTLTEVICQTLSRPVLLHSVMEPHSAAATGLGPNTDMKTERAACVVSLGPNKPQDCSMLQYSDKAKFQQHGRAESGDVSHVVESGAG